jgi:hypothetical protein
MPDMKEVYEMVTQQTPPKPGALERQQREQRRRTTRRRAGVYGLVAALVIVAVVFGVSTLTGDDAQPLIPGSTATPSPSPIHTLPDGALEPGTYIVSAEDPGFDASYRITISVPDGYEGFQGWAVLKRLTSETGVSAQVVSSVYADPCHWSGAEIDPSLTRDLDSLVAALVSQPGRHASTPTDVTVDGFAGKYMEQTVPAGIDSLVDCDGGEYRSWLDAEGARYHQPGEHNLLWIVDVDGVPLVIDAAFQPGTSAQLRAELLRMVESIRIDPW